METSEAFSWRTLRNKGRRRRRRERKEEEEKEEEKEEGEEEEEEEEEKEEEEEEKEKEEESKGEWRLVALEGEGYYIHMLSDSCFTSTKAHIIALWCHTGIHNKQLGKESSERFACIKRRALTSTDMCPYIKRHVPLHQQTCALTSTDMCPYIKRHVPLHQQTCALTSTDMCPYIKRHVPLHQATCALTSTDMCPYINRHVPLHQATCALTSTHGRQMKIRGLLVQNTIHYSQLTWRVLGYVGVWWLLTQQSR